MSPADGAPRRRLAVNTAIFSVATGLSRIAGLGREVVASNYFGASGAFSAFTIANQVPNLMRALFADAALSAAFVPVFTELLEQGKKKEAMKLASSLFVLILCVLGAMTGVFIAVAPWVMPLVTGGEFTPDLDDLTVGLSQVLFPIVVLLALNGLVVAILNSLDHFSIPALSPLVWNVVILVFLVGARRWFDGDDQLYAYAIGILVGTAVQYMMCLPMLRKVGVKFDFRDIDLRDPRIKQVLTLMLPVTIALGAINFGAFINSTLGTLVSESAPRAIEAAFRIYMLPQGMFSVAVATVLFPALSRLAARKDLAGLRDAQANGIRLVFLLLLPSAAFTLAIPEPLVRLVYERGNFTPEDTELVAEALFWFSLSLPFSGANLMLTRTFFSLQQPWVPTVVAIGSLLINAAVSLALYSPFGVAGLVLGTVASTIAMTILQTWRLRPLLAGIDLWRTLEAVAWMLVGCGVLAATAAGTWYFLDDALGRGTLEQLMSVTAALAAGTYAYIGVLLLARVPEAEQLTRLFTGRFNR